MSPITMINPLNPFGGDPNGETQGKIEAVLTILRARFNQVPKRIEEAIRRKTEPIALDSLAVSAETCQSLEEFENDLD